MSALLQRRLPGVRFDVPAPALDEALPRMDIAFFAGFTACGPVDLPVAVESLAEFEDVFGAEITLLERADGSPVRGLLHPSLRQFFAHGGRRAWVLRVAAAHAQTTRFPLQQMLLLRRDAPGEPWRIEPAFVAARSPGSWADAMTVFARCEAQVLAVEGLSFDGRVLALKAWGPLAIALTVGDTLQLVLDSDDRVQGRVAALDPAAVDPSSSRLARTLRLDRLASLRRDGGAATPVRIGWTEPVPRGDGSAEHHAGAEGEWHDAPGGARLLLHCRLPATARLAPGEVVRVAYAGGETAWMALDEVITTTIGNAAGETHTELRGRPWRVPVTLRRAPLEAWLSRGGQSSAHWLRAEFGAATHAGDAPLRLAGLALVPRGDGVPGTFELPDDVQHYAERVPRSLSERAVQAFELAPPEAAVRHGARFPLASLPLALPEQGEAMLLPLATGAGLATGLGARGLALPPLRRDGLDRFDWTLFVEPSLAGFHADALAGQAEALRMLGRRPRALRGLHAVFGSVIDGPAEEPTLLLIPDAVQPGWQRQRRRTPARRVHPQETPPASVPDGFIACALTPLAAPQFDLAADADPDATGHFVLSWTPPEPGAQYELQEAADLAFSVASPVYAGPGTRAAIAGRPRGTSFYRVRAAIGARLSPWSNVLEVHVGARDYALRDWDATHLLALHRLMLRAAAGRGDMLALLGLPEHYGWADALAHVQALRSDAPVASGPPALGADEARALSHGALHHPWLVTRRVDDIISCPPDGAIAGQLAASALARGAWFAVANQPLKDVVALGLPAGTPERQALLEAQVNPIVATPAGFVAGSSETLLLDADWRPVNVRRLMGLVRRAALRRGATYVFEPEGEQLRRTVERAFEALMEELLRRGAFAGTSAAQAYRVNVGPEINTPARRDAGRFHVDLKLAPALPLTFLTVRLVRHGERLAAQELR